MCHKKLKPPFYGDKVLGLTHPSNIQTHHEFFCRTGNSKFNVMSLSLRIPLHTQLLLSFWSSWVFCNEKTNTTFRTLSENGQGIPLPRYWKQQTMLWPWKQKTKELARVIPISLLPDEDPIQALVFKGAVRVCVWFNFHSSASHRIDTRIDSDSLQANHVKMLTDRITLG